MAPDPRHIRRFLELVKNLADTHLSANPGEKREIVEWATSNRRVSGKSIYLEPANWLMQTESAIAGLIGAPARTTSRTEMAENNIILLNGLAKSDILDFVGRPSRDPCHSTMITPRTKRYDKID